MLFNIKRERERIQYYKNYMLKLENLIGKYK